MSSASFSSKGKLARLICLISKPGRRSHCEHGALHGPFPTHYVKNKEHRAWYCDNQDCQQPTNVLATSPCLAAVFSRFRTVTPSKLWNFLLVYFASEPPRLARICRASGLGTQEVSLLMTRLRQCEAMLGRREVSDLLMTGRLEVDATGLRKAFVSPSNGAWKASVQEWKDAHGTTSVPSYFLSYVRAAGMVSRGENSQLLLMPLSCKLLSPGSRPPTESNLDVTVLRLQCFFKTCQLFCFAAVNMFQQKRSSTKPSLNVVSPIKETFEAIKDDVPVQGAQSPGQRSRTQDGHFRGRLPRVEARGD